VRGITRFIVIAVFSQVEKTAIPMIMERYMKTLASLESVESLCQISFIQSFHENKMIHKRLYNSDNR